MTGGGAAPTATDGGPPAGRGVVWEITPDPDGPDGDRLDGEYVVFENAGDEPLDLSGWTVTDAAGRTYTVPDGYVLDAGATVTLRTGTGTDTDADLYWGSGAAVWNNDGDTVIVRNSEREPVLRETYP